MRISCCYVVCRNLVWQILVIDFFRRLTWAHQRFTHIAKEGSIQFGFITVQFRAVRGSFWRVRLAAFLWCQRVRVGSAKSRLVRSASSPTWPKMSMERCLDFQICFAHDAQNLDRCRAAVQQGLEGLEFRQKLEENRDAVNSQNNWWTSDSWMTAPRREVLTEDIARMRSAFTALCSDFHGHPM